jgi:phosphatidylserine/phosphatidylglycerophosphate/cardiolipin synthase-like enzyme
MQAYLFTNPRIARALLAALHRGVPVEVIGDAREYRDGGLPWLAPLARAGARVFLDESAAASHNKIVIVDGDGPDAVVVTGSYNFTRAAQDRNAENVVVIRGNRAIADRFVANFRARRGESRPWEAASR